MPSAARQVALAGISLRPDAYHGVVVHGAAVELIPPVPSGRDALRTLLGRVVSAARGELVAVTVDLSPSLLDALVDPDVALPRVEAIRVVPRAATDPAMGRSPSELVEQLVAQRYTVAGGHDLLGHELCPLDRTALARVCGELRDAGSRCVAVTAPGSQARPHHERAVADAVQAAVPDARIVVASEFGGQGLARREATVLLDCALAEFTGRLLDACEHALGRTARTATLRVARGDGGCSTPASVRAHPAVVLGANETMQLGGAAHLHGQPDCRVVLAGPAIGEVRRGLPVIRPGELTGTGIELVVPTAGLAPVRDDGAAQVGDVPVVTARLDAADLAAVGAAVSRPSSWLDEVAFIESVGELEQLRRDAERRATAIVMANGAVPGTTNLAEASMVAVPYGPAGTVRIRVRVTGASEATG